MNTCFPFICTTVQSTYILHVQNIYCFVSSPSCDVYLQACGTVVHTRGAEKHMSSTCQVRGVHPGLCDCKNEHTRSAELLQDDQVDVEGDSDSLAVGAGGFAHVMAAVQA